jgi:glycosyltransferase involved in cell wall biosynthesis
MKIAYVTTYEASDIHTWSGLASSMLNTLENSGFETKRIGNLRTPRSSQLAVKAKKYYYEKLLSKNYLPDRDPSILRSYADQVYRALESADCDVIFSPGTLPIACLRTGKPIVFWTDATFAGMVDFYPEFNNVCSESVRNGNRMEQAALSNCQLAVYASEWAAKTAIENYDVDPSKIRVVPFGANLSWNPRIEDIEEISHSKDFAQCKLLFIGVDWLRKGGPIALKVAQRLNELGMITELHVVGCTLPGVVPEFVKVHGFVSKKTESGKELLDRLYRSCHFLIVPSRAECFGVVFAEASAHGLPSLATNVGGIPSAIRNGFNGQTFDLQASEDEYCSYILTQLSQKDRYYGLSLSAYDEYSRRLNWTVAGKAIAAHIQELCGSK